MGRYRSLALVFGLVACSSHDPSGRDKSDSPVETASSPRSEAETPTEGQPSLQRAFTAYGAFRLSVHVAERPAPARPFLVSLFEVPPAGSDGHPIVQVASASSDGRSVELEATAFTDTRYILELRADAPDSLVSEWVSTGGEAVFATQP
jgi:hypothetical protein